MNYRSLDTTPNNKDFPRFVTKKWTEVYDQSEENYDTNQNVNVKVRFV